MENVVVQTHRIGIIGRGIIGTSWALVFARAGFHVRIWRRGEAKGSATLGSIAASIQSLAGTGLEGDADTMRRVSVHERLEDTLCDVDFVQESVPEDLAVKHDILSRIEAAVPVDAIIASSTSGIMPSRLAEALSRPERFL